MSDGEGNHREETSFPHAPMSVHELCRVALEVHSKYEKYIERSCSIGSLAVQHRAEPRVSQTSEQSEQHVSPRGVARFSILQRGCINRSRISNGVFRCRGATLTAVRCIRTKHPAGRTRGSHIERRPRVPGVVRARPMWPCQYRKRHRRTDGPRVEGMTPLHQ
jgi:hypothetical protein